MSAEAKRVKILTLIELLLGLVMVVGGAVFAIRGVSTAAPFVLCGEGVLTLLFGGRGALIANVPARIGKLVTLAFVVLLLQIACAVAIVMLVDPNEVANHPIPVVASVVPAVFSVAIALLSRGIAKRAER